MKTEALNGSDLRYWVARANYAGSNRLHEIQRKDYGQGDALCPSDVESMRRFVASKFGNTLPAPETWH